MELPTDIHSYLAKWVNPKKYTLLNKFCRDCYFRKNGIKIRIKDEYMHFESYTKYEVKILGISYFTKDIKNFKELEKISQNVVLIKYGLISAPDYVLICKTFPKLKKLKCEIIMDHTDSEVIENIPPLKGTLISPKGNFSEWEVKCTQYNFIINWSDGIKNATPSVRERITRIVDNILDIDLDLYPNLEHIAIHRLPLVFARKNMEKIINHPNLRKVICSAELLLGAITKKNGLKMKYRSLEKSYYFSETVSIEKYNLVKSQYDEIDIDNSEILESIINHEKASTIYKRLKLTLSEGVTDEIEKVIELFSLTISVGKFRSLNEYAAKFAIYKMKTIGHVIKLCLILNGRKFWVIKDLKR